MLKAFALTTLFTLVAPHSLWAASTPAPDDASRVLLEVGVSESQSKGGKRDLVANFNAAAADENSKIAGFLAELRKNNDEFQIEKTISTDDILRLDSGGSAGTFSTEYLIVIRGGFKSNIVALAHLKATQVLKEEDGHDGAHWQIYGPVDVTIP